MQLEVGSIVEGKVTSITKFGAFVALPENRNGLVHISEVSTQYVKEVTDFLKESQIVKVKIISVDQNGRINLSIKQVPSEEQIDQQAQPGTSRPAEKRPPPRRASGPGWQPKTVVTPTTFEEMMTRYKQDSEDKISTLRRSNDAKRGSSGRRR